MTWAWPISSWRAAATAIRSAMDGAASIGPRSAGRVATSRSAAIMIVWTRTARYRSVISLSSSMTAPAPSLVWRASSAVASLMRSPLPAERGSDRFRADGDGQCLVEGDRRLGRQPAGHRRRLAHGGVGGDGGETEDLVDRFGGGGVDPEGRGVAAQPFRQGPIVGGWCAGIRHPAPLDDRLSMDHCYIVR